MWPRAMHLFEFHIVHKYLTLVIRSIRGIQSIRSIQSIRGIQGDRGVRCIYSARKYAKHLDHSYQVNKCQIYVSVIAT